MNVKFAFALAGLAAMSAGSAWSHSMSMEKVGFNETGGRDVASGETATQSTDIILDQTAKFYKTGAGTLKVPLSKVNGQKPYSMAVIGGTLELTEGTDSTVDTSSAPAICQSAAYWVNTDSAYTNADGQVLQWYDVREPAATRDPATSQTYVHAYPGWYNSPESCNNIPPLKTTKYDRDAVYFGGHQSGKYLKWSSTIQKIHTIFLVHGVFDTWGAAIGYDGASRQGGFVPPFSSGSTVQYSSSMSYTFLSRADISADLCAMRVFVDGEIFPFEKQRPQQGFQLLECQFALEPTRANTFFFTHFEQLWANDTNHHQGGDYISEAIIFTNQLTEVQRLDVERYLMKKWNLPRNQFVEAATSNAMVIPKPVGQIGVGKNGEAVANIATDAETAPLVFNGEGSVVKRGAGTLVIGNDESGKLSSGSLTLEDGAVMARQGGRLPPLKLVGGNRYTAAVYCPVTGAPKSAETEASGLKLTRADVADASTVVKDGDGQMTANAVADGVKSIRVEAGVLQLEAKPVSQEYVECGVVTAVVSNADFELPFTEQDGKGYSAGLSGGAINGWGGNGWARYYSCPGWAYDAYSSGYQKRTPLDGTQILHLSGSGNLRTTVTLPAAGIYELNFLARNRYGRFTNYQWYYQQLNIGIGPVNGTPVTFASIAVNDGPWQHVRVRLPYQEAGSYKLQWTPVDSGHDGGFNLDDVRLVLVGENEPKPAFEIPNGNMEYGLSSVTNDTNKYLRYSAFDSRNRLDGWTFTNATGTDPAAGFTGLSKTTSWYSNYFYMLLFNWWDKPLGTGVICLLGNTGSASTTFTAPAGTFRLRGGLSRLQGWAKLNGTGSSSEYTALGKVSAKLKIGDNEVDLGSFTATNRIMTTGTWPTAFTLSEAQEVTLTLTQSNAAMTLVDDLVFVDAGAVEPAELIADGTFEDMSRDWWSRSSSSAAKLLYTQTPVSAFGYAVASGTHVARISGYSKADFYQNITIPEAGIYRLRLKVRSRADKYNCERNPLKFTLLAAGGEAASSQLIGKLDPMPHYRQFVEFDYLVRVESAGTYKFAIEPVDHSASDQYAGARQSFVDDVSFKKVGEALQEFTLPEDASVTVCAGAQLRLDFTNTVTVSEVRLGNKKVYGIIDQTTHPDYVFGPGALEVPLSKKLGTVIMVK